VFRQRSAAPDPESSARQGYSSNEAVDRTTEVATKVELDAYLSQVLAHADLGLPVGPSERFRLAKRVVSRICWPFLRRQVAFNHAVSQSNRDLVERLTQLQERIEHGLRNDLLDFADQSASQAHAEISNYVAEARSVNADLILEIRSLQAELTALVRTVSGAPSPDGAPARLEGQDDVVEIDNGTHESYQ
jgi:hypothetical protein